jgi:hypothetical protein
MHSEMTTEHLSGELSRLPRCHSLYKIHLFQCSKQRNAMNKPFIKNIYNNYNYFYVHIPIEVRSPAGEKDFSSNLCFHTGSGAHPASCTTGTGG